MEYFGSKDKKVDELLSRTYYDESVPGSYGGASALGRRVKGRVSGQRVRDWLTTQETYNLHKTPRRRFPRRKTIVSGPSDQWQADLIDVSRLKKHNRGMTFILTMIDVFSKIAFAVPLKNKTAGAVSKALADVLRKKGVKAPSALQTDKGREFLNRSVKNVLEKKGVRHFVSQNEDIKCAIVERFNRTLKEKLWRYFTAHNTLHYLRALPRLLAAYNKSYHRSIGMAPSDVSTKNQERVWQRLYGVSPSKSRRLPLLKVGDTVRISKSRRAFKKTYLPSWSTETFRITSVLKTSPTTYRLKDERGEVITGSFYEQELQKVGVRSDRLYKIDKVLKRRGKSVLVRWEGYPPSFDSWIKSADIRRV